MQTLAAQRWTLPESRARALVDGRSDRLPGKSRDHYRESTTYRFAIAARLLQSDAVSDAQCSDGALGRIDRRGDSHPFFPIRPIRSVAHIFV